MRPHRHRNYLLYVLYLPYITANDYMKELNERTENTDLPKMTNQASILVVIFIN